MKEDVWKQDIGQWVERKGRSDWVRLRQPIPPPLSSARPAAHAGFLPSDFEDKPPHDFSAVLSPTNNAAAAASMRKSLDAADSAVGEMRWVTVHGVSAGGIMDLREYFDVNFGRTLAHISPDTVRDGALSWLHVKFEDPTAAARAVFQSPVAIPSSAATRTEEVVGIVWCNDTAFLDADRRNETTTGTPPRLSTTRVWGEGIDERNEAGETTRTAFDAMKEKNGNGDDICNAAGVTPCGADRLRHHPHDPTIPNTHDSPNGFLNGTHRDHEDLWQRARRTSRGFLSVLRDALGSPFSASRMSSTAPLGSRQSSHSHGGIPSFLSAGRNYRRDPTRRQHRVLPVWPLPGNASVLSVFRADKSQRGVVQRASRTFRSILPWVSSLLTGSISAAREAREVEEDFAVGWTATVRGTGGSDAQRHDTLLRARHFGAAGRLRQGNSAFGEVALAHWEPCRWYERGGMRTLGVLFVFFILVLCWRGGTSMTDMDMSVRPTESGETAEKAVTLTDAEAEGSVQLQGTLFADGRYGSDAYHARTL